MVFCGLSIPSTEHRRKEKPVTLTKLDTEKKIYNNIIAKQVRIVNHTIPALLPKLKALLNTQWTREESRERTNDIREREKERKRESILIHQNT